MRLIERSTLVAFIVAGAVIQPLYAADSPSADFLFSEDGKVGQTPEQFMDGLETKTFLPDDKWLNAPLTRLDYVLLNIQTQLNSYVPRMIQRLMLEYFERTDSYGKTEYVPSPEVELSTGYFEKKGRLMLSAKIENLGKPKKPMKVFCEKVIAYMDQQYPLNPIGYSWHNNALGLLMRDDTDKYNDAANALSSSAAIVVTLTLTCH